MWQPCIMQCLFGTASTMAVAVVMAIVKSSCRNEKAFLLELLPLFSFP